MTPEVQPMGDRSGGPPPSDRIGDWIQTFTGIAFWPLDPRQEEINLQDIAHALSMQCRFTGHVQRFYSVAEHSVRVSYLCEPADALWGLLHDASEAYLCDLARPIKRLPELVSYRDAEKALQSAIVAKFGLPAGEPESVQRADKTMLAMEARDLMGPLLPGWEKWDRFLEGFPYKLGRTWAPGEAEDMFHQRFREIQAPAVPRVITVAEAASILGHHAAMKRAKRPKEETRPELFESDAA